MVFTPPDTEARNEFYEKLMAESPDPENWDYEFEDGEGMRTVHPIQFGEEEVAFEDLYDYLETVENRLDLAKFCMEFVEENSDSFSIEQEEIESPSDLEELRQDDDSIRPEFIIRLEYFFFAIRSLLDTLGQIINLAYGIGVDEDEVNIYKVKQKLQEEDIDLGEEIHEGLKEEDDVENFNKIRNRMTHHYMFNHVSSTSHPVNEDDGFEHHTRAIKVNFSEGVSETFILPDYLHSVWNEVSNLVDNTFSALNEIYTEVSDPDGTPRYPLLETQERDSL